MRFAEVRWEKNVKKVCIRKAIVIFLGGMTSTPLLYIMVPLISVLFFNCYFTKRDAFYWGPKPVPSSSLTPVGIKHALLVGQGNTLCCWQGSPDQGWASWSRVLRVGLEQGGASYRVGPFGHASLQFLLPTTQRQIPECLLIFVQQG